MQSIIYTMQAKIKYLTQYDTMGYAPVVEAKSSTGFDSPNYSVDTSTTVFFGGFFVSAAWHLFGWLCGEPRARRFRVSGLSTRMAALFCLTAKWAEYSPILHGGALCTK